MGDASMLQYRCPLVVLFESLIERFKSSDLLNYIDESKVSVELNHWETSLETICGVLDDAEEKELMDAPVRTWRDELRKLAYKMEDIVDELNSRALQSKFHAESEAGSSSLPKLLCSFADVCKFRAGTVSKMQDVSARLADLKGEINQLGLCTREDRNSSQMSASMRQSLFDNDLKIYGREDDYMKIHNLMELYREEGICVISIVGIGGIGKTTLARLVYRDSPIDFEFKAWVSVGNEFDPLSMTKTILQPAPRDATKDLDFLQGKLMEKLNGKKFLFVLDDVWDLVDRKWILFSRVFAAGAPQSTIIITTRVEWVSQMIGGHKYYLSALPDHDCLRIFADHALGREDFSEHPELKDVGYNILKECGGRPLIAKVLGGALRDKPTLRAWHQFFDMMLSHREYVLLSGLTVCYYCLSPQLKQCFLYCARLPKNYEFSRDEMVLLWLAEGFLQELRQGYEYFDELLTRSFFQRSFYDTSIYEMLDLIHDLAQYGCHETCFVVDEMNHPVVDEEHYHVAFNRGKFDMPQRFENLKGMKHLRTFLALPISRWRYWDYNYLSSKVLNDLITSKLQWLRVLSFSGYESVELPESIKFLRHLRYLNMAGANIDRLPESLSELFNLRVLILSNCRKLLKLPKDLCQLINLQYLDIRGTDKLQEMPLHIGKLVKLEILNKFIVGKMHGCSILELQKIPNLQGQLHIVGLQNVGNIEDGAFLMKKEKIDELLLEWRDDFDGSRDVYNEQRVLGALEPCRNIKKLSIKSYGGKMFPSWLGSDLLNNVSFLELCNCHRVSSLPPLGQLPILKHLRIKGMSGVKEVGMKFYGKGAIVFPSLEILQIENMVYWKQWVSLKMDEEKQVLHRLQKLEIRNCPELVGNLPKSLPALKQLEIVSCPLLKGEEQQFRRLEELVIELCNEVVLKSLTNLGALTKFKIRRISGLPSFPKAFLEQLVQLKEMEVESCDLLKYLWEDGNDKTMLMSLEQLHIQACKELESLVGGNEGNLPPNLKILKVYDCEMLEKLSDKMHELSYLTGLKVSGCPKLKTIATTGLPRSVKRVNISACYSLERLPAGIIVDDDDVIAEEHGNSSTLQASHIEELELMNCDALILSPNGIFPDSLRYLAITGAEEQLFGSLQKLSHLVSLEMWNCQELESFPDSGLPLPNLLYLRVWKCRNSGGCQIT